VELDPGCTYLLLNRRQGLAKDEQWARYFAAKLNSFRILNQIPEPTILQLGLLHAHGLKPGWHHSVPFQAVQVPTKSAKVSIAYQAQHPLFPIVIKAIEDLLAHDGIRLDKRPYTQEPTDCGEIDIWLKPMGISNYRDDALQGWLLSYSGVEMTAPDQQFQMWQSMIQDWRAQDESAFPAKILARDLVTQLQLIPLFHCWLGVNQDHCGALQNAQCNALGWFDFSQVWVRPEMLNNEASQD
ncbi:MAG: SgrR family transcriptional regulator, partial [Vibrio sp.]